MSQFIYFVGMILDEASHGRWNDAWAPMLLALFKGWVVSTDRVVVVALMILSWLIVYSIIIKIVVEIFIINADRCIRHCPFTCDLIAYDLAFFDLWLRHICLELRVVAVRRVQW